MIVRTLVRVADRGPLISYVLLVVPAWDTDKIVAVERNQIPRPMRNYEPGTRFHVKADLEAASALSLVRSFHDWETD